MSISESIKKRAADAAAAAKNEADKVKAAKIANSNDKISQIDRKIAALREQGGFEGAIERLQLQKAQLENKLKHTPSP